MKKLILAAFAVTCAVGVFAQGTIVFNNRVSGTYISHVYAPLAPGSSVHQVGQGSNDTPPGAADWTGYSLIGIGGLSGANGAATTFAQLIGAPGFNQPELSLVPANNTTTFRSAAAIAGTVNGVTSTFTQIPADGQATVEMVAWDNSSGLYPTWTSASVAWLGGLIAAGESGRFNTTLGGSGAPPYPTGAVSFNLYMVPEPSTFALAGLGAAAMLIFRRRK